MRSSEVYFQDKIIAALEAHDYSLANSVINELKKINRLQGQMWEISLYLEQEQVTKARACWRQVNRIAPQDAQVRFLSVYIAYNEGQRVNLIGDITSLIADDLMSDYKGKLYNLLGQCWRQLGEPEKCIEAYKKAGAYENDLHEKRMNYSNYLFNSHYVNMPPANRYKEMLAGYASLYKKQEFMHRLPCYASNERKIRIGFLSADLHRHVVLCFAYSLIANYDKNKFVVYVYSVGQDDDYSDKLAKCVDKWQNIAKVSNVEKAKIIYNDKIDILMDLGGHTKNNCLEVMALKPAPIEVSGIGYWASTGVPQVDYFMGDAYLDKIEEQDFFTEKILRLPHTHFCYMPLTYAEQPKLSAFERNGYITFGSFNNFTKVNRNVLSVWREILMQCAEAHLLLKADIFNREETAEYAMKKMEQAGLPMDRIEIRGITKEYLPEYGDIDIVLDTFPYPGGGTTCDALYMGRPVITLCGEHHGSRFGYSIMCNLGMKELVADSETEYIRIAVSLAEDKALLALLHRELRHMLANSPLMDRTGYQQQIEEIWEKIWKKYQSNENLSVTNDRDKYRYMLNDFLSAGDYRQAMAAADRVLYAGQTDTALLEQAMVAYMDGNDMNMAHKTLERIQMNGSLSPWGSYLAANLAFYEGEGDEALLLAKQSLKSSTLTRMQKGAVYHLMAEIHKEAGNLPRAVQAYWHSAQCKEISTGKLLEYSNYLLHGHYYTMPDIQRFTAASHYQQMLSSRYYSHDVNIHKKHKKIRVGYISPDFNRHVVASFADVLLANYDERVFSVYVYTNCMEDDVSKWLKRKVVKWCNFRGWTVEQTAEQIYQDEIDILMDLAGHTANNSLPVLALKPAPIQISGIGYFATTGLKAIDYFLTDKYSTDETQINFFTEKLLVLSHSHLCYTPLPMYERIHGNVAPFTYNGYITFGSFNNFAKVTDEVMALWGEILHRVQDAKLLLKAQIFSRPYGKRSALMRLQQAGIPRERVIIAGYSENYIDAYADVDIALDTFPYPGGGTTCDALYMGVPVIALAGRTHHERFGYSLLANVSLSELCAHTKEEYLNIAVKLAEDKERLREYHQILPRRMRKSALMNRALYIEDLEKKYGEIWTAYAGLDNPDIALLKKKIQTEEWEEIIWQGRLRVWHNTAGFNSWESLAIAYFRQKDYCRAAYCSEQALKIDESTNVRLYYVLGKSLHFISRTIEAMGVVKKALENTAVEMDQELKTVLLNFFAQLLEKCGYHREAAIYYTKTMGEYKADLYMKAMLYGSVLLTYNACNMKSDELLVQHKRYNNFFVDVPRYQHDKHRHAHKKIRVGYVSPDFRNHVMFRFYMSFLTCYDNEKYDVYCYSLNREDDDYTAMLKSLAVCWRDIRKLPINDAADIIYQDEIDILVDLAGHTADSGLPIFAYKPAPVQISGIGYMATTGLNEMDYFLTDRNVGGGAAKYFTERLLFLDSQFCYHPQSGLPVSVGAPSLERGWVLFGVFNRYSKITDEMLLAWKAILSAVPNSRILLKSQMFIDLSMADQVYERLRTLGFDMDRVLLEHGTTNYMERYLDVDIALDTYPYPGGGTTCDALYMGVPVITLYTDRYSTRFSYGILKTIGIESLAAVSVEQYIDLAISLAKDTELLNSLHKKLRDIMQKTNLLDEAAYMADVEKQYEQIWQERRKTLVD